MDPDSKQFTLIDHITEILGEKFSEMETKINYISSSETDRDLEVTLIHPRKPHEKYIFKLSVRPKQTTDEKEHSLHFDPKLGFQSQPKPVPGPNVQSSGDLQELV